MPVIEKIRQGRTGEGGGIPALYLVKIDGKIIGMLEKWVNTRTEKHPWKAFVKGDAAGMTSRYIRAFYPEDGGKKAAIQAIVDAN